MKQLGFVAALVLMLCVITFFTRQPSGTLSNSQTTESDKYTSAINAAKGASKFVDATKRRTWIQNLPTAVYDHPDPSLAGDNAAFGVEGESSEFLIITSNSIDSSRCTAFAYGDNGVAAAREGFTGLRCNNRTNGAVYDVPLSPAG